MSFFAAFSPSARALRRTSLACFLLAEGAAAQRPPSRAVAIVGVSVIDPASTAPAVSGQTVVVADGVVRAIGPTGSTVILRGARRILAQGKFVIPGLWDAHVHFMNTGETALPLLLALGVTSVREMGGYIDSTRAWQARMNAGTLAGPRVVTAGPVLESPRYLQGVRDRSVRDPRLASRVLPYRLSVGDSLDAARAIDSLVTLRVDFAKVRTTESAEAYYAILRHARRVGLKVAGHQPSAVSLLDAIDSGQYDVEHAISPPMTRLPDSTRDAIYRRFAERGTWYTPTLVVSRAVTLSGDSASRAIFGADAARADERRPYASPWLLEWWRMQVDERIADTSAGRTASARESYVSSASDVRRMWDAGVKILAGTDAGSVLVYPGFSLHEELLLLVEDGKLTPREALWAATVGPARFAGMNSTLGSVAPGRIADLVLLDADPLTDIRNTRRIAAVMQGGRLYTRADLDTLLRGVRRVTSPRSYAILNGRWFDGRSFVSRTMYVSDGRFVRRRPAAVDRRLDLAGRYVVAPYGEAHNHNIEGAPPQTVKRYLDAGIFYVEDPESFGEATANAVGVLNIPTSVDAIFAGGGFTSPDGHPSGLVRRNIARGSMKPGDDDGRFMYPIRDSADFDRRWPGFLAHRTDFVKVLLLYSENHARTKDDAKEFNWHGLDPSLVPLIVRRAHAAGLTVTAHIESAADFHTALTAGVDQIAHMPGFRPAHDSIPRLASDLGRYRIADADARLAAARGVTVVTTLGSAIALLARGDSSGLDSGSRASVLRLYRENLRTLRTHGARIVFGSDEYRGNTLAEVMQLRTLGVFSDEELLSIWSIETPRSIFPRRRIGCFESGCEASFLALADDPLRDFRNVQRITLRMKQGVLLP